jgi:hypothetical protein
MQNNHPLHIVLTVLTVQMVAESSFFGMIFGPWKQNSMSPMFTSYTLRVAKETFPT